MAENDSMYWEGTDYKFGGDVDTTIETPQEDYFNQDTEDYQYTEDYLGKEEDIFEEEKEDLADVTYDWYDGGGAEYADKLTTDYLVDDIKDRYGEFLPDDTNYEEFLETVWGGPVDPIGDSALTKVGKFLGDNWKELTKMLLQGGLGAWDRLSATKERAPSRGGGGGDTAPVQTLGGILGRV